MKKIICIILSLFLISSVFFGCAKEEKKEAVKEEAALNFAFDSTYKGYDQSAVNAYETMCKSVLDYNENVRINTGLLDKAQQLFYTSFPLCELVSDIKINGDNSGVVLNFKKSEEEHKKTVNDFKNKVKEIKTKCFEGTTNSNVYAVRLYNYIASNIVKSEDDTITCLDTFLTGKGSSFSYSQMFEYMLRQADIPTYHVIASDALGNGWGIAGAELDGNLYYFDLFTEYFDNQGKNIKYFGMTSEDLENEGLKDMFFTDRNPADDASDTRFDTLRNSDTWKLEGAKLLVTLKTKIVVEIAL